MRRSCLLGLLLLCVCVSGRGIGARQSDPILDAWGFEENRSYLSELPFEHIDTMTGNVLLTFTDLELPGNGGLDVRLVRTFNSKPPAGWNFGLDGYPFRIENPDGVPPGAPNPQASFPRLLMPDGARYDVFSESAGAYSVFRTKRFWRYHVSGRRLQLPNGTECFYNASGQLTAVQDTFGNRIELTYGSTQKLDRIRQILGTFEVREITFTWHLVGNVPATMSYLGRVWTYGQQLGGGGRISSVTPPAGGTWQFDYQFDFPDILQTVTTPHGGSIVYDFQSVPIWNGSAAPSTRALVTRWTYPGGSSLSGTWTFQYPSWSGASTTVTGPHGVSVDYTYSAPAGSSERALQSIRRYGNSLLLEQETHEYQTQAVTSWGSGTLLLPSVRRITRDSRTYTTTLSYHTTDFADYGRPWRVEESGDRQRTTAFTFDYAFDTSRWIKNRVSQETTTVDSESFTISRTHNFTTGFMESETRFGITHFFAPTPDARGNLGSETDPHAHTTTYTYSWGALEDTTTPHYTVQRAINPDGTVASEIRRGGITTFDYDAIGRRTWVRPPHGHGIETRYFTNEVQVLRGDPGSRTRSFLDGFGRVTRTENSVNVVTTTRYDALGRKIFESLPFEGTAEVGTIYRYDGLSRLRQVEHTDGQITTRTYETGGDVRITEQNGAEVRITVHDHSSFGEPFEPQLVGVTDAEAGVWTYRYNGLGKLTQVTQPGGTTRTWTYFPGQDLLQSESHPESGVTTYTYNGGRLATKTTPRTTFTYGYDANDRLTNITVPGVPTNPHSVTMDYDDSDNRILLRNEYVNSSFRYDTSNRLEWRRDIVQGQPDLMQTLYAYDDWDNLRRLDYPSGEVATYTHDTEGRPTSVTAGGALLAEALDYHPSGAISRLRLGNNIIEDFGFHPQRYWPESISGGPVRLNYTYQPVGNIERIDNLTSSAFSQQFTYDRLDRVKLVTGFGPAFHQYDALGNRTWKDAVEYRYHASTKRLTEVVGAQPNPEVGLYFYDPDGATQIDPSGTYTYTPFAMLETAQVGSATTTYLYDGDNIRKVRLGAAAEFFFHGRNNELLSEWRGPHGQVPTPRRDYVYLGSRLVASLTPFQSTVSFATTSSLVTEGSGSLTVTVRITIHDGQPLAQPVSVSFATAAGTAQAGQDYTHTAGTLTFPTGTANNATRTIAVPILNDTVFEQDDEAFTIALSAASNTRIGLGTHTVTIRDDEPLVGGFLDLPAAGAVLRGSFQLGGWVIDHRAASGSGIDAIDLYARQGPAFAAPGIFLGRAIHNERPDVAAQHGQQFLNSGYGLLAQGLPPGAYDIVPYVHVVSNGSWVTRPPNRVTAITGQAMNVELPAPGAVVNQAFIVQGWAIDQDATSGTGVDLVQVTAQPLPAGAPIPLGNAVYGGARQDVANVYGDQRFLNSGFSLTSTTLAAGSYRLDVSARSTVPGAANQVRSVTITVRTDTHITMDAPAHGSTTGQPFLIGGWAVDLAAASGTGIATIHVWAYPLGGGNPVFLGVPAFGPRPDIAGLFGSQFLDSGWTIGSVSGLAPGQWQIVAYAMSALTGTFNQTAAAIVTLPVPDAFVVIDLPGEGWHVGQPFGVTGWAIDRASPNTVGIAAMHVYAYPWSGAPPIFIGAPLVNGPRPDVAAAYGAHYTHPGWGVTASGLPPGTYTIIAYPISTGNQVVPGAAVRVVTVAW
jgi:YD repeat-containing protein